MLVKKIHTMITVMIDGYDDWGMKMIMLGMIIMIMFMMLMMMNIYQTNA